MSIAIKFSICAQKKKKKEKKKILMSMKPKRLMGPNQLM
jgi:hypothetical protein